MTKVDNFGIILTRASYHKGIRNVREFPFSAYDIDCETEVKGLGINATGYPGAFTAVVNKIIEGVIERVRVHQGYDPTILHLFSGVSNIGDVRVDIARPEATTNRDVREFLREHHQHYDITLLDPPYDLKRKGGKLAAYGKTSSVAADVALRRSLAAWFRKYTDHVLWLDTCAPLPSGFLRSKLWFLLPGGYHTIRVFSWLTRSLPDD